jgi:uncharacterized protein YceK
MKYEHIIKIGLAITLLSGCAAIDKINAKNKAKLINYAKESCMDYGFKEGTDTFANCMQREINQIKNRSALESAASK